MFNYLPEQASEIAPDVDWLNDLITNLSVFFTVAIVGAMLYFAIRYRRRDGIDHETPRIEGSNLLEIIWTVVPTIVCVFIAYYGVEVYQRMRFDDPNATQIAVWGQKWKWDFEYPNGKKSYNDFVVPVNRTVKLTMKSHDVLHSFFLPAMRVKKDVIPSIYTTLLFKPVKVGTYQTFCAEYCGKDHSAMLAKLHVVSEAEYERWLNDKSEELAAARISPAELGQKLYVQKGCNACHSLDGSRIVGPSFLKVFGKMEKCEGGSEYMVDENYVHESILNPKAKIVMGFAPVMPSFEGQLTDKEIDALIAFIKSVKEPPAAPVVKPQDQAALANMTPAERGKNIYETNLCITCHSLDGSKIVGPSFKGVYGRQEKLTDGSTITVDDAYIKKSVYEPAAQVVEGYPPAMPPYQGKLNDDQIKDVIEFLKTVK